MEMTRSMAFIVECEVQHGLEQHILELFINTIIYCMFCPKKKIQNTPKFAYYTYIEHSIGMWFFILFLA